MTTLTFGSEKFTQFTHCLPMETTMLMQPQYTRRSKNFAFPSEESFRFLESYCTLIFVMPIANTLVCHYFVFKVAYVLNILSLTSFCIIVFLNKLNALKSIRLCFILGLVSRVWSAKKNQYLKKCFNKKACRSLSLRARSDIPKQYPRKCPFRG